MRNSSADFGPMRKSQRCDLSVGGAWELPWTKSGAVIAWQNYRVTRDSWLRKCSSLTVLWCENTPLQLATGERPAKLYRHNSDHSLGENVGHRSINNRSSVTSESIFIRQKSFRRHTVDIWEHTFLRECMKQPFWQNKYRFGVVQKEKFWDKVNLGPDYQRVTQTPN